MAGLVVCLLSMFLVSVDSVIYLNRNTCKLIENPITYEPIQLNCLYRGPGLYKFEGQSQIQKVTLDRVSSEAHVLILTDKLSKLKEFEIITGSIEQCDLVSAPANVQVKVGITLCSVATVTPEIFSSFTQHSTTDHHYTTSFTHHPDTTLDIDVATAGFHHRTEVAPSQISDSTTDRHYTTSFTQPPETTLDIDVTTAGSRHRTEVTSSQVSETPRTRVDIPYTPQEETSATPWIVSTAITITVLSLSVGAFFLWRKCRQPSIIPNSETNSSSEDVIFQISARNFMDLIETSEF